MLWLFLVFYLWLVNFPKDGSIHYQGFGFELVIQEHQANRYVTTLYNPNIVAHNNCFCRELMWLITPMCATFVL